MYLKIKDELTGEIVYLNLEKVHKVAILKIDNDFYYQFELFYQFVGIPGKFAGSIEMRMQAVAVRAKWSKDLNKKLDQVTTFFADNTDNGD